MKKFIKHWENNKILALTTTKFAGNFSRKNLTNSIAKIGINDFVWCKQVHGSEVEHINNNSSLLIDKTDGLITNLKRKALVVRTADCVPVFFTDTKYEYVAVAHAGWKGSLSNITKSIVNKYKNKGINPKNIKVYIGPHIRQKCYEVKNDVASLFKKNFGDCIQKSDNKLYLSLTKVNLKNLLLEGIDLKNISLSSHCTYCEDQLYYSYRRDKYKSSEDFSEMVSLIYKKV